ncbi:hypothetical protein DEO72_LG11g2288 [Vigna unguiculata]|uniref:Uncharacterized protein n=1 Tax=Vigna unguiculata TaxID=3917 RepID=A0A4D6NS16_VIGUN|nr:hypothetical protein DEO72_LG11g2288 [Vigna unguiculata]
MANQEPAATRSPSNLRLAAPLELVAAQPKAIAGATRHEPLFPTPTSRPRKLPGPSEPPAMAPIATRSVAGLRCILNVSRSSSRINHAKSGIHTASPAVAPPTVIEVAAAQSVPSSTRRR